MNERDLWKERNFLKHYGCGAKKLEETLDQRRISMDREKIRQELYDYFKDQVYWCERVPEAWSYGTMGLDDFVPAWEDDDIYRRFADRQSRMADMLEWVLEEGA